MFESTVIIIGAVCLAILATIAARNARAQMDAMEDQQAIILPRTGSGTTETVRLRRVRGRGDSSGILYEVVAADATPPNDREDIDINGYRRRQPG